VCNHKSIGLSFAGVLLVQLVCDCGEALAQPGGGGGGAIAQGVYVDATGVLRTVLVTEKGDRLKGLRRQNVARATGDVAGKAQLRKVSLARLTKEVKECVEAGKPIPDELRYLAGITQIQYLFVYPEENDLVIAGPAEGWELDAAGRVVGTTSKRPVLRLDDLVVALRVFPPNADPNVIVGCSINQTVEGVRNLNQYLASLGSSVDRRSINASMVQRVRDSLGLQDVEIWGVPGDSRLAAVLVEADYRMKLIGIGLEEPRVRGLSSYYSLLGPGDGGMNKLQRWWFVPDYEAIEEGDDGNAFEFRGQRAKLVGADEKLKMSGEVERGETVSATTKRFAQSFSSHFEELTRASPIYAEMQNAFDWVVFAALIQQRKLISGVAPELSYFLRVDGGYEPEVFQTPKQAESVANAKWIGTKLAIPVGGGVVMEPVKVLNRKSDKSTKDPKLTEHRQAARTTNKTTSRWWMD